VNKIAKGYRVGVAYDAAGMSAGAGSWLWRLAAHRSLKTTQPVPLVRFCASSSSSREHRTAVAQVKATAATACSATPRTILFSLRPHLPPSCLCNTKVLYLIINRSTSKIKINYIFFWKFIIYEK